MNDQIIKSYLDDFSNSHGFESSELSTQFEHFVNYCIVAREYESTFDVEDISTGKATGIDGIAIFVNDVLVSSPAELDGLPPRQRLDVRFNFMQAKTSASFDLGDLLKFLTSVEGFFSTLVKSEHHPLENWLAIKETIYKKSINFDENPRLALSYATTGTWKEDKTFRDQIEATRVRLLSTKLFSNIDITIVDADRLKTIYRGLSNKVTRQISFDKHTILPKIPGVKRAFIGILPCAEYLKLIRDDDNKLLRNVFYDNVRDYQGENSVNREIIETLKGEQSGSEIFVLLNNGVTIVAKSINPVGTEFTVRDFQVVNGCQTSHILHNNFDILSGNEFITVKLIETDDLDLTNNITKATNRQTEIKLEAFAGLRQFHKELEAFYASMPLSTRLYYERRSGQYAGDHTIPHSRIISIPNQIKSFVSVFLEEPHQIHFYYGQLLRDYSTGDTSKLFSDSHEPYPYYLSSWLVSLVSDGLKKSISSIDKRWRYHLALMVRLLAAGPYSSARLSDAQFSKRYCETLLRTVDDKQKLRAILSKAADILLNERKLTRASDRQLPQEREFTRKLIDKCIREFQPVQPVGKTERELSNFDGYFVGRVKVIVPERDFGFVGYGQRQFRFKLEGSKLTTQQAVRFKVRKIENGFEAYEVSRI